MTMHDGTNDAKTESPRARSAERGSGLIKGFFLGVLVLPVFGVTLYLGSELELGDRLKAFVEEGKSLDFFSEKEADHDFQEDGLLGEPQEAGEASREEETLPPSSHFKKERRRERRALRDRCLN